MTCKDCKHCADIDNSLACRRYPPQLSAPNYSQFPAVKPEWNCGEFAAKTTPKKSKT